MTSAVAWGVIFLLSFSLLFRIFPVATASPSSVQEPLAPSPVVQGEVVDSLSVGDHFLNPLPDSLVIVDSFLSPLQDALGIVDSFLSPLGEAINVQGTLLNPLFDAFAVADSFLQSLLDSLGIGDILNPSPSGQNPLSIGESLSWCITGPGEESCSTQTSSSTSGSPPQGVPEFSLPLLTVVGVVFFAVLVLRRRSGVSSKQPTLQTGGQV
jgi:hypothetical protein